MLRRYHGLKSEAVGAPNAFLLERLVAPGEAATVTVYMLRAIHGGGAPAQAFLDSLVDEVRGIMTESVATGLVRPSRDEEARLRYLTHVAMGAMLVQFLVAPDRSPDAFVASLRPFSGCCASHTKSDAMTVPSEWATTTSGTSRPPTLACSARTRSRMRRWMS